MKSGAGVGPLPVDDPWSRSLLYLIFYLTPSPFAFGVSYLALICILVRNLASI